MKTLMCTAAFLLAGFGALAGTGSTSPSPQTTREIASESRILTAHKELARQLSQKGFLIDALHEYQSMIAANPHDGDARFHVAELFAWMGDYDHSIVTYDDLLRESPSNLQARIGMAEVLRWSHRYAESEQQLKLVLKVDPENLQAIKGIAQTFALAGDFTDALTFLNKGIALYPREAELVEKKGTVLSWSGNLKDGIALLKAAVTLAPSSASAYRSLADGYTWRREFSSAAENYRKALDLEPNSIETALDLARAYLNAGSRSQAEEVVKQVLRTVPDHHQALELLQEIRRNGALETARTMDIVGEPIALMGILTVPAWFLYRRQRVAAWRSNGRKKIYRFAFPVLFFFFLAAYTLRIIFETNLAYKVAEILLLAMIAALSLFMFWDGPRVQGASQPDRVLVIGAHPDDIELGAAGAVLRLAEEGAEVYGLIMTQGEIGSSAPIGTRENEAYESAASLGLRDLWVMNFPDTKLRENIAELRKAIEEKIKELGVRIVLTHSPHETHGDHVAVFEAAKEAARACSLLCYESISAPKEFVPNYFVDITRHLPAKISAISTHKTQSAKFYMDPDLVKGRAAHRGLQAGVPYAEAFWVYRWVR